MSSNKGRYMMRRGALISPWGVGAIVPFPNDDIYMIAGLDAWNYKDNPQEFRVEDDRLRQYLHVSELRLPPDFREENADNTCFGLTIPVVRFPTWYYCPNCGQMEKAGPSGNKPLCGKFPWPKGRNCTDRKKAPSMVPERFVVVCPAGHIDDIPIMEMLHNGNSNPNPSVKHTVRRSTGGESANIASVSYTCTCGKEVSIASFMKKGTLQKKGYKCTGRQPWFERNEICSADPESLQIVLRGATNVWFANTISSLCISSVLPEEAKIKKAIDDEIEIVKRLPLANGTLDRQYTDVYAKRHEIKDKDLFYERFKERLFGNPQEEREKKDISEDEYRFQEYQVLCKSCGKASDDFFSINLDISEFNEKIKKYFKSITLVHKLKETRAFIGFSRLIPDSNKSVSEKKKELRLGNENWLPAIQISGEGIFFRFNEENIREWGSKPSVKTRIELLNNSLRKAPRKNLEGTLSSEFVLIHTFAHLLINQLSFECGYGSSSLRERIYCQKTTDSESPLNMYGVLIYTASGDSEGSLGGLVRQGKPGRLEDTILNAVQTATWCSSDPVCIQSNGQGPDSLNLAACHNCALLPETCCENGNRFLDRGMVIGTLEDKTIGYFKELLQE